MGSEFRRPLILVVAVVLIVVVIVGVFAYNTLLSPSRSAPQPSWHEVGTYSGAVTNYNDVSQNTTVFQIRGSQIRVHWEFTMCCDTSLDQSFSLMLYSTTNSVVWNGCLSTDPTADQCHFTDHQYNTANQTVNMGPGVFYLRVIASLGQWNLVVSDYY